MKNFSSCPHIIKGCITVQGYGYEAFDIAWA